MFFKPSFLCLLLTCCTATDTKKSNEALWSLNEMQQHLSCVYIEAMFAWQTGSGSQRQLVEFMKEIISKNVELGIGLHSCVWNTFFTLYFQLDSQFRHSYVCKLLDCMQLEGSNVKPDLETFVIILSAISQYDRLALYVIRMMTEKYEIEPDGSIHQIHFSLLERSGQITDVIDFVVSHSNIPFTHKNKTVYKELIQNLMTHHYDDDETIKVMMSHILYGRMMWTKGDMHRLVHHLDLEYPHFFRKFLVSMVPKHQRFRGNYGEMLCILTSIRSRGEDVEAVKNTFEYKRFQAMTDAELFNVGDDRPITPDPVPSATSTTNWAKRVRGWRRKINRFQ